MKHLLITIITAVRLVSAAEAQPSNAFWNDSKIHRFHLEMSEAEWEAMKALDTRKGVAPADSLKKIDGEQREVLHSTGSRKKQSTRNPSKSALLLLSDCHMVSLSHYDLIQI